jgi:glycosyltransferase involved in cell wall biosynthesis
MSGIKDGRNRRRILQITANPFPPAIRVMKEGLSFLEAGYQSAVLCPPTGDKPEREMWRGISVYRPKVLAGARRTIDKVMFHTTFWSPAWVRAIREVILEYRPDVLHVHDVWLGRCVFLVAQDQKVVMDLHENWSAAVVEYLKGYRGAFKWFNAVFKGHDRVARYERALLRKVDMVLVVVEEALQRVTRECPDLAAGKTVIVENLESKDFLQEKAAVGEMIGRDHFSILYIGGFGPHRGIDTLIAAMKHVKQWGLKARLYLVGARSSEYLRTLRELVDRLDVGSHVSITGWVPFDAVLSYIRQASIGVVPHHSNPHTNNTIPHKLFQYMIAGTPVLVSTSPPLARTVAAAGAGTVFLAGDDLDCAIKIRDMYNAPDLLKTFAGNGFKYVMESGHNWEDESAPALIAAYDRLLKIVPESVEREAASLR